MPPTTFRVVAGSVLSLAVLAGCTTPAADEQRPDIATLRTAEPASAAPPSPAARERPVIRPDEGREAWERYYAVWLECMHANGVPRTEFKPSGAKAEAAQPKCQHLYPENWMEREARTNPEYVDRLRETAKCLKDRGHDVTVGGSPVNIMYGDNASANRADDDLQECEQAAFREEIKKYEGG
jgi:hypothetical protein